jgi:SAM-dependent methyltransferase
MNPPDLQHRLKAFYNTSGAYKTILIDQKAFRLDVASEQYVSLVAAQHPTGIVLDLGCGTAETTRQLAARGYRVVGVDISLLFLRASAPVRRVAGDLTCLPFLDHSVGCVGLHNVIEHVPDTDLLLREIVRVLGPGGVVVIVSPNLLCPLRPLRHLLGVEGFTIAFYGSRLNAVKAIFVNLFAITGKIIARQPHFTMHTPLLDDDFQCPDDDAVYMANVIDLQKWFRGHGFVARYRQFLPHRQSLIGRTKLQVLNAAPWLDKGFALIASAADLLRELPGARATVFGIAVEAGLTRLGQQFGSRRQVSSSKYPKS